MDMTSYEPLCRASQVVLAASVNC